MEVTVEMLLRLNSMLNSYVIAGHEGIHTIVKRIDILETPFPEIERYLEPSEFMFTTFWNSKESKENRVNLVKSMIKHNGAGIGILADNCLNGIIDDEIIELGNKYLFPVISLSTDIRYSDIISEFSLLKNSIFIPELEVNLTDILYAINNFDNNKDLKVLCDKISDLLSTPIICISTDNIYYSKINEDCVNNIIYKINSIKKQRIFRKNIPAVMTNDNINYIVAYYGKESIIATYLDKNKIGDAKIQIFNKIAPVLIEKIDNISINKLANKFNRNKLENGSYYYALIKKNNIFEYMSYFNENYHIFEIDNFYNYFICLIENKIDKSIYKIYSKILKDINPDLFIFSKNEFELKELYNQISILNKISKNLMFLKGLYTADEIIILSTLLNTPYYQKDIIYKTNEYILNYNDNIDFLNTLRIYLSVKSISNVSDLLDIHPNSVKYRIDKVLNNNSVDLNNLTELPYVGILYSLELLNIEYIK